MIPDTPIAVVNGKWSSLPLSCWPIRHQEAWQVALRCDTPVRRGGRASSLSSASRQMMQESYGTFLWWLHATGVLDLKSGPEAQMTDELLGQFLAARRKTVSDNTTYNNLRMLAMMMNCLVPGNDWKWIWRHGGAPRRWEARAARRQPRSFSPGLLVHRLVVALQRAADVPIDNLPLERVRDCLLVAMAVNSGLRPRNQSGMRLDHNLIRRKAGWEVIFHASEVKNGEAILFQVPALLNPFVDRYLLVDRPRLATKCKSETDAVWLSSKGRPLAKPGIAAVFNRIGKEMLGYPLNPNCVRHVQATRLLDDDPRNLATASLALAHTDPATVSMFYDQSGSRAAQAVWLELLADLPSANSQTKPQGRETVGANQSLNRHHR